MKKSTFSNSLMVVMAFIAMSVGTTACSSGDTNDISNDMNTIVASSSSSTDVPFSIVLKAIDTDGYDITTQGDVNGVTLYVFDQNNKYYSTINVDKSQILNRKSISINCSEANQITVIALGGLNQENENVSIPATIEDLEVSLNENNGNVKNASDLFYGKTTIAKATTKSSDATQLQMTRKSSTISLTTKNLVKYFGNTEGTYTYKVKNVKKSMNYKGILSGSTTEYTFNASFNANNELVSGNQVILGGSDVVVELYKDGKLLYSQNLDKNGEKLSVNEGKRAEMFFEYSSNTTSSVFVADWGTAIIYATVG